METDRSRGRRAETIFRELPGEKTICLKVAIVGCGKIADSHVAQIHRIAGCEIVGVCDREPLMARQLYERFPVKSHFSDLAAMLNDARPDVVHITTPPESHFEIARLCLAAGCHVYVEKPFTLNESEARKLIALASQSGLKLTVGHDDQFRHAARRMRALIGSGFLGGAPVHMESYYCYELGRSGYAGALLGDKRHWVRRLPGKLLHNIISHGIARIAEYLAGDAPQVIAHGFVSPLLRSMGETDIIDELRVIITDEERTTAYFTFSSETASVAASVPHLRPAKRPHPRPGSGDPHSALRPETNELPGALRPSGRFRETIPRKPLHECRDLFGP